MTEYVNQCARCGSSIHYTDCIDCDGEGVVLVFPDEDNPDDTGYECPECDGDGFIAVCMSTRDWCQDHPLPGCEHVPSCTVQGVMVPERWFRQGDMNPLPPADESCYGPDARPIAADLPVQGEPQ